MSILGLLGFALLFAVFGFFRLADRTRNCQGCPHDGGCGSGCGLDRFNEPSSISPRLQED